MSPEDLSDIDTVFAMLARGGFVPPDTAPGEERPAEAESPRYNGLLDPAGAEDLGTRLATALRVHAPDVVLIWQSPEDIVLAHVVARELGVTAVRSYDLEGLVAHDGDLSGERRVAIVSDAFVDAETVKAMAALLEQRGASLVAAGCLVAVDAPGARELVDRGVPLVALVDLREESAEGGQHG